MVLVVMGVALAGGTATAGAASAPAYRSAADRVCASATARVAALPAPRTGREVRAWVRRAVPIMLSSTRRLRALRPPTALRARHRAWSVALGRRARTARVLRSRIAAGAPPVTTLQAALPRLGAQKRRARAKARALGLRACAGRPRR
jgi:hypothetical protein